MFGRRQPVKTHTPQSNSPDTASAVGTGRRLESSSRRCSSHRARRHTRRPPRRRPRSSGSKPSRAICRARRHWGSAAVSFSPRFDGVAMCGWGAFANPPPSRNGCERYRGTARLGGRRPLSRRAVFAVMPRATRRSPLPSSRIIPSSFPRCIRVRALPSPAPSSSNTVVRCSVTFFRARCARDRSFSHQDRDRILTGLRIDGQHGGAAAARWAPAGFAIRPRRTPARP
jgi:hypothetical protein